MQAKDIMTTDVITVDPPSSGPNVSGLALQGGPSSCNVPIRAFVNLDSHVRQPEVR